MNPYYPRHWGIGFGKGGAGMRRPLSQEYCLNYTVNYRKIEKYDKIAKKRIFIVDYYIAPLRGSNLGSLRSQTPLQLPICRAKSKVFTKLALSRGAELFVAPMEQDGQREACGVDEHGCRDSRNGDDFTISAFGTG